MTHDQNISDSDPQPQDPESGAASEEADRTVADLEHQSDELDEEIDKARSDWESKQESSSVPGAVPDPGDQDEEPSDPEDEATGGDAR